MAIRFKVRDPPALNTSVLMTAATKVSSHGIAKRTYPVTYTWLSAIASPGKGDADVILATGSVDEQDLRSAQIAADHELWRTPGADQAAEENAQRLLSYCGNTALARRQGQAVPLKPRMQL